MSPGCCFSRLVFALCAVLAAPLLWRDRARAQEKPLSPVVQVAVNYGPGKSTMVSGFLVGGGRFVLTQGNILDNAYDIAVALTDTAVLDPVMEHVDERFNLALLRLPGQVKASLSPAAVLPEGETAASIIGAPEAFEVGKSSVRLTPLPGTRRWKITPSVPPAFRGAPILNSAGELIGIAVEERPGTPVVGIPVSEFAEILGRALAAKASQPAAQPAAPAREAAAKAAAPSAIPAGPAATPAPPLTSGAPATGTPTTLSAGRAAQPAPAVPSAGPSGPSGRATQPEPTGTRAAKSPPAPTVAEKAAPSPTAAARGTISTPPPAPPLPVLRELGRPLASLSVKGLAPRITVRPPPEAPRAGIGIAPVPGQTAPATGQPAPAGGRTIPAAKQTAPGATEAPRPAAPAPLASKPAAETRPPAVTSRPVPAAAAPNTPARAGAAVSQGAAAPTTPSQTPAAPGSSAAALEPSLAVASPDNIAAWEARIASEPNNLELRFSYAAALTSARLHHRAVDVLEKAQAQFPSEPNVYWNLAHAYWQQSLLKENGARRRTMEKKAYLKARAAFENFLRLAPDDHRAADARYRLKLLRESDFGRY